MGFHPVGHRIRRKYIQLNQPGTGFSGITWTSTFRRSAATHPLTEANLRSRLAEYRLRLEEAGLHNFVQFYQDNQAGAILNSSITTFGDTLLAMLLTFESQIVEKANAALNDIQKFLLVAGTSPTKAVDRLAQFAADIVTAFNQLTGQNVFANLASFRAVAQLVFADASRALNPALAPQPRAMPSLDVLNAGHAPDLTAFLNGTIPVGADVAVA